MASTTWVSELPSSAAAWCAEARSVLSILIVRCGRRPDALATRRCGNGGGGSQGTAGSRSSWGPARARRRTRACTACRLTPRASASERSGQPASVSAASVPDSSSLRPDERSSRSRVATRSGSRGPGVWGGGQPPMTGGVTGGVPPGGNTASTYCRSPFVTTSDIVRPSRASRARSRCRCSWSSRNVSSRRDPCDFISPRRGPGLPPGRNPRRASCARPRPGRGTGASRRRAAAGSSRAAAP